MSIATTPSKMPSSSGQQVDLSMDDVTVGSSQEQESSTAEQAVKGPREMSQSKGTRVSGKAWKLEKTATRRSYLPAGVKTPSWEARQAKRSAASATKSTERLMKAEKEAEELATRLKIKERRERRAERVRMEELEARLGRKKALRMKKRQGRTKKINQ